MTHLANLAPLYLYLLPSVFDLAYPTTRALRRIRPILAGLLLCAFTGFGLVTLLPALTAKLALSTSRGTVRLAYRDQVLPFVQRNLTPGAHLYVHPYQPMYSFMLGTINPTRYDFLMSGMATAAQYRSAIRDLAADRTPTVLLNANFAERIPVLCPSAPLAAIATDPLADYILRLPHLSGAQPRSPPKLALLLHGPQRSALPIRSRAAKTLIPTRCAMLTTVHAL